MLKELIILIDTCRTDKEKKKTDMPKELIIPIKTLQNVISRSNIFYDIMFVNCIVWA